MCRGPPKPETFTRFSTPSPRSMRTKGSGSTRGRRPGSRGRLRPESCLPNHCRDHSRRLEADRTPTLKVTETNTSSTRNFPPITRQSAIPVDPQK
uniref:SH3 and SYLF domain containing 1 n=1 Tax=Molossus molossus TaxID=27622 RepID=A0A7J8E4C2_MOLMO|nr:SH3 and SYLF domain containing 1 [Molossus molossus]